MKLKDFNKKDVTVTGIIRDVWCLDGDDTITIETECVIDEWVLPPGIKEIIEKYFRRMDKITLRYFSEIRQGNLCVKGYVCSEYNNRHFNYYIPLRKK